MIPHQPASPGADSARTQMLRQRALEHLRAGSGAPPALERERSPEEVLTELQIHQVELELQNRELRETQVGLERARSRYFALFDLSPVAYFVLDAQHRIQELNLAAAELIETTRHQAQSRPFVLYLAEEFRPALGGHLAAALASSAKQTLEARLELPSRQPRHVLLESLRMPAETGREAVCLTACLDITARIHAEEQRLRIERKLLESQKLESIGVLAGGIAHDFNNLLTGILGNTSLARMRLPAGAAVQPLLDEVEACSQRAAELCQHMLAYAGKGRISVARLDLSALVRESAQLLQLSINKRALVHLDLAAGLPAVLADTTQLRQVIMNLVMNASEAIGNRDGVIRISTAAFDCRDDTFLDAVLVPDKPESRYVSLSVEDNGCGMSTETKARIFEPFFTTKFTGRGLGLASALGIIRSHKGALKVRSTLAEGSTFTVLLPACLESVSPPPPVPPAAEDWQGSGWVLVVDDEQLVRDLACRLLQAQGFQTVVARDGRHALEVFAAERRDWRLILLDLTMPFMDGVETLLALRGRGCRAPVLVMSGYSEQEVTQRLAGQMHVGFLQKPFTATTLRDRVRAVLDSPVAA